MNQHRVFPKRLTIFSLIFLVSVLSFGLFSVSRNSKLLSSFNQIDVPALQLSCAATRVMGDTVTSLNTPDRNRSEIAIQVAALDDSLNEIIALTSNYPDLSNELVNSVNYQNFKLMVQKKELDENQQKILVDLKGDLQNLIERYLLRRNEDVQQNIHFSYISVVISIIGAVFFFVLIFFIYLSYQRNVENLQTLTKNLEKERLATIQSSKLASLGEMAAGLAHEINNPLAVIIGRSEILLSEMSERSATDLEISKTVSKVLEMANRISKIVQSMRKISKSSGHAELSDLNLSSVVDDVLNLSQERIKNSSIVLDISGIDKTILIKGNFTHLSQVIINLVNNCVDELMRMPENKRQIWFKTATDNNYAFFKVIDSGPGIPSEMKDKLFEPFFTTKDVGKGTGLGLSISKTLMTDMDGDLTLESDEGRTCFVLKLPIHKA